MQLIEKNYFQLFTLPEDFCTKTETLGQKYRDLQASNHPDRYAQGSEQEKLAAVQLASYINDAYSTLKSPLKRAAYLLQLKGINTEQVSQHELGMDLLMEQMQLRETLEDFAVAESSLGPLDGLRDNVRAKLSGKEQVFGARFEQEEFSQAKACFHEMQFLHKLLSEINTLEERILDY